MRPEVLAEALASIIRALVSPLVVRMAAIEGQNFGLRVAALEGQESRWHLFENRLLSVEMRAAEPGPPGPAGPAGKDGADGKDGAPGLRYVGLHVRGKTYDVGDVVTFHGSAWYCGRTTTTVPEASRDWQLMVQHGRDLRRDDRP